MKRKTPALKQTKRAPARSKTIQPSRPKRKTAPLVGKRPVLGCDVVIQSLEHEGVDTIFAYPGGQSMLMHQALTRSKTIRTILPRHEQGGAFMAEGYARATGKPGVCMATSGPGATNLITGIADAYMDSVPLIAITGQVPHAMIGKGAFQETDVFGVSLPIVKHSYLVLKAEDIPHVIKEAFHIAQRGRPGPVLIDIPKDVQLAMSVPEFPETVSLRACKAIPKADDQDLRNIISLIEKAERPVLYVGGGIISSDAAAELKKFAERTNIPVASTLMGVGGFPENHRLSLKWLGMHGTVYANYAVDQSDLLLAFGVRFDDRVTGKVDEFAKHGTIVHVDIDNSELNKNKKVHHPILSDIQYALKRLNQLMGSSKLAPGRLNTWHKQIDAWKKKYPLFYKKVPGKILPQEIIRTLYEVSKGDCLITTGVGQHQMWSGQFYNYDKPRSFLTSAGLGAMGFGYPAALGAKVACPGKEVIDIDGDGSFLMNIQELATAVTENIPAKVIIINNQHLGMVVQWEDRFFESNRGHTYLGNPKKRHEIYPDYLSICQGFGVPTERVSNPKDLRPALQRMLRAKTPYVLDIIVPYTEHVLPMIPANKTVRDMIIEPME